MLLKEDLFLIGVGIWGIGMVVAWTRKRQPIKIVFWSMMYLYAMSVLAVTLFPIPYDGVETMYPVPHNIIPFRSIFAALQRGSIRAALIQIGGNIALSVPYGVMLYLVSGRQGIQRFLSALLFPFVIENLQLLVGCIIGLNYRSFDIDDFILNTLGVYLGYILGQLTLKPYREKIRQKIF